MKPIPEDLHREYEEYRSDGLARLPEAVAKTSAAYDFIRDEYGEHEADPMIHVRYSAPGDQPNVDHVLRGGQQSTCVAARNERKSPEVFYLFDFPGFDQDEVVLNFLYFCREVLGANLDKAECWIAESVG